MSYKMDGTKAEKCDNQKTVVANTLILEPQRTLQVHKLLNFETPALKAYINFLTL